MARWRWTGSRTTRHPQMYTRTHTLHTRPYTHTHIQLHKLTHTPLVHTRTQIWHPGGRLGRTDPEPHRTAYPEMVRRSRLRLLCSPFARAVPTTDFGFRTRTQTATDTYSEMCIATSLIRPIRPVRASPRRHPDTGKTLTHRDSRPAGTHTQRASWFQPDLIRWHSITHSEWAIAYIPIYTAPITDVVCPRPVFMCVKSSSEQRRETINYKWIITRWDVIRQ